MIFIKWFAKVSRDVAQALASRFLLRPRSIVTCMCIDTWKYWYNEKNTFSRICFSCKHFNQMQTRYSSTNIIPHAIFAKQQTIFLFPFQRHARLILGAIDGFWRDISPLSKNENNCASFVRTRSLFGKKRKEKSNVK